MKKILPFVLLLLGASPAFAGEGPDAVPCPEELQLKDQMRGLMQVFRDLEVPLGKKPPDYDAILKLLDEMNTRVKAVRSLKASGHPGKKFDRLLDDLADFRKNAKAKNHSGAEDSMNRLAEDCFRCHLSHDEPAPSGKSL
ncbi:MAG TPA: hypothetical protein VFX30_05160 [bacterium]|nr:hypothetical protein [bacterium]